MIRGPIAGRECEILSLNQNLFFESAEPRPADQILKKGERCRLVSSVARRCLNLLLQKAEECRQFVACSSLDCDAAHRIRHCAVNHLQERACFSGLWIVGAADFRCHASAQFPESLHDLSERLFIANGLNVTSDFRRFQIMLERIGQKSIEGFAISNSGALFFASAQTRSFRKLIADRKFLWLFVRQLLALNLCFAMTACLFQHLDDPLYVLWVVIGKLGRFVKRSQRAVVVFRARANVCQRIVKFEHLRLIIQRRSILPCGTG